MGMDDRGGYGTFDNQTFNSNHIQLTIDHGLESLFLSDYDQRAIYYKKEFANVSESTAFKTFVENISKPAAMAIVGKDVFWTTTNQSRLYWAPKNTSTGTKTLPIGYLSVPETVQLATIAPVIKSEHICAVADNVVCSHICVALSGKAHSCLCPDGMCFTDGSQQHCESTIGGNCGATSTTTTKATPAPVPTPTTTTTTEHVFHGGIESSTETHPDAEHTYDSHVIGIAAVILSLLIVIAVAGAYVYNRRFRRSGTYLLVSYS